MKRAVVDTAVLTDALLKSDDQRDRARSALGRYAQTMLPVYALKEFKAGPLHYYVWLHNKAVEADSMAEITHAIRSNIGHRRNLPATALQAVQDFQGSLSKEIPAELLSRYTGLSLPQAEVRELRIWLRSHILRAWRRRSYYVSEVIAPLSCYDEQAPTMRNSGQMQDDPRRCGVSDCCMRTKYASRLSEVKHLEDSCVAQKREVKKRRKALKRLRQHPTKPYDEEHCQALGDAVFTLECPADAVILTTNVVDHGPLASALGRRVEAP